jgi:hypothetical protein
MLFLETGNGSQFSVASSGGAGQFMATSVAGDSVIRAATNSLCIGTASTIKFGTTVGEWGRFSTSGQFLVGTTAAGFGGDIELRRAANTANLDIYASGDASANNVAKIRLYNNAANGAVGIAGNNLVFYNNDSTTVRASIDVNGTFKVNNSIFIEQDNYNIYLRALTNESGGFGYDQKFFNSGLSGTGDPAFHYVALCRAYNGGANVNKSYFLGQVVWSRGSSFSGNYSSAVQVFVASAFNSNAVGGVNLGQAGASVDIVQFTAGGISWLGVRASTVISFSNITVIGAYASSAIPASYTDAAVSSVTVLRTLA